MWKPTGWVKTRFTCWESKGVNNVYFPLRTEGIQRKIQEHQRNSSELNLAEDWIPSDVSVPFINTVPLKPSCVLMFSMPSCLKPPLLNTYDSKVIEQNTHKTWQISTNDICLFYLYKTSSPWSL